jgi:hypothetical protein
MLTQIKTITSDASLLVHALSYQRLSNYRRFFGATSDAEVMGVYQWNEELSAAFFRTIALVEIVLRNKFHRAMSLFYGAVGTSDSLDWYMYVSLNPASRDKIKKMTHQRRGKQIVPRDPLPSPDAVISALTFGFWPHLLDLKTDIFQRDINWGEILVKVLPGHRQQQPSYWRKLKHRDALFCRLELCDVLRNRIAHHEPIWKLGPLLSESRARRNKTRIIQASALHNPSEALSRLALLYTRITELLAWLSPPVARHHESSITHIRCTHLLKLEVMMGFLKESKVAEINLSEFKRLRSLRKTMRYVYRRKQPLLVKDDGRVIGYLTCQ